MAQSGMLGINLGSAGSGHLATSTSMLSMNNPLSPHRSQGLSPRMPSVGMVKQSQSTYNFSNDYPSTDHFISQEEGESVVAQTVDMLINEAFVVLYDRQLQAKLIPFVASRAKQDLITLIRVSLLSLKTNSMQSPTPLPINMISLFNLCYQFFFFG
eukprot:TRINITY_DN2575_c0_g1_i6.p1 TRINITY_DN2575_c0_g1~~TRINITY_DN2575_c0_g1_i6.p1  ORF type:complete len:156 (+),score=22.72 TRINITY_DN2575_c0_g1_i6:227-694(+)